MTYTNYKTKMLLLSALPKGSGPINAYLEIDNITRSLDSSTHSQAFLPCVKAEATYESVIDTITNSGKQFFPKIIYYAGHSDKDKGLRTIGTNGQWGYIDKYQLKSIVDASVGLQLLFLNSCESAELGEFIYNAHPEVCVISISGEANADLAVAFSRKFYEALFSGESYANAFKLAIKSYREKGDAHPYNPVFLESNIAGLHPLLTGKPMPDFLQRALPGNDEIISSEITNKYESYDFEQFSTKILHRAMFLEKPRPILIVGEGGAGKTAILAKFYAETYNNTAIFCYRVSDPKFKYSSGSVNFAASDGIGCYQKQLNYELAKNDLSEAIIIIDGYNELSLEEISTTEGKTYISHSGMLRDDIIRLMNVCGQRMILTSREVPAGFNRYFDIYQILPLHRNLVQQYLTHRKAEMGKRGYSSAQILRLADLLRTPLLLRAFLKDIWGKYHIDDRIKDRFSSLYRYKAFTPTDVLWNYLCIEMLKTREDHEGDNAIERAETAVILLRFIAPYIAHKIFSRDFYEIYHPNFSIEEIETYLVECLDAYNKIDVSAFADLSEVLKNGKTLDSFMKKERVIPLLENRYHLMCNVSEEGQPEVYEFDHQSLAEILFCIHEQNGILYSNFSRGIVSV